MHKQDYFKRCMDHEAYRSKAWVFSAFSVVYGDRVQHSFASPLEKQVDQLRLKRLEDGRVYFQDPHTQAQVFLDGTYLDKAVFEFRDPVTLQAADAVNLNEKVDTTYGAWLFNAIAVVYPFKDKIAFSPTGFTVKEIESIIEARLADDPEPDAPGIDAPPTQQPIYVSEYKRFNDAMGSLTGFTTLCVPAATERTLTVSPALLERRKALFEQYKDQLHDPVIQAKIGDELIALDKQWIEQDPERGFYYKNKSFQVVRKKLFMFQGSESGFGKKGDFIPTSLDEGIQPKDLPTLASASRHGSFSRGALTALGGEATKFNLRMFQNASVIDGDCGTVLGRPVKITQTNQQYFIDNYYILNTQPVLITKENSAALVGQTLYVRSPMFCLAEGASYCEICVGKRIASTREALATYAGDIGSAFLSRFMAAMHGKVLATAHYDFKEQIS